MKTVGQKTMATISAKLNVIMRRELKKKKSERKKRKPNGI